MKKVVVLLLCLVISFSALAKERTLTIWAAWASEWVRIFQEMTDRYFTPKPVLR